MAKKNKSKSTAVQFQEEESTNKIEAFLKKFFSTIRKNKKTVLIGLLIIIVLSAGLTTYKIIKRNKKEKIATGFYKAYKEFAEKLKAGIYDINTLGMTIKKLRKISEMSTTVEETLLARYFLGVLHFNIGKAQNKPNQYFKARDYFKVVAEHEDFAYAPQSVLAMGSSYEQLKKPKHYKRAIQYYNVVVERYPDTVFANRALYKKGLCYIKLKKKNQAIATFNKIPRYFGTEAAGRRENIYYTQAQSYVLMLNSQR